MATNPTSPKKNRLSDNSVLMRYATMGTQMLVIMGAMTFGGYWLDKHFGLQFPVLTVCLSLLGIAAALYLTLKDLLKK
jgi:hypothetical protein